MKVHRGLFQIICSAAAVLAAPVEQRAVPSTFYYFSFGDSYTTTGFNIHGQQPSAGNPMGNPPLGTTFSSTTPGTFAGGVNYVGYLTTKYNSTDTRSYNFAVPGACVDGSAPGCNASSSNFDNQVTQYFEPMYTVNSPWKTWNGNNSIFSIFFGINDIDKTLSNSGGNPGDPDTVCERLVTSYLSLADNLYAQGARRFLFFAVPPIDRTPYIQTKSNATIQTYAKWVNTFNYHLGKTIPTWQSSKTGVSVSIYDIWHMMTMVLDNPTNFGFPDAECANSDGQSCIWWNIFHPSSKFNEIMAQRMVPAMNGLGFDGTTPRTGYYYR